jgi:hypothetical protein
MTDSMGPQTRFASVKEWLSVGQDQHDRAVMSPGSNFNHQVPLLSTTATTAKDTEEELKKTRKNVIRLKKLVHD